jgi:hypothetical protein
MAFMPWNYDLVKSMYHTAGVGYLQRIENRVNLNPQVVAHKIRELVQTEGADPHSPSTRATAMEACNGQKPYQKPYMSPTFGYVSQWLSEVGTPEDIAGILRHADDFLGPKWENGGYFYPRCDDTWDEQGNWIHMDPYTGNAGIAYARLNVHQGQKKMFEQPWTPEQVDAAPHWEGLDLGTGVDCVRGVYDEEIGALVATLRTWHGKEESIEFVARNLPAGRYEVYVDGTVKAEHTVEGGEKGGISIPVVVGGSEVDVVVLME